MNAFGFFFIIVAVLSAYVYVLCVHASQYSPMIGG